MFFPAIVIKWLIIKMENLRKRAELFARRELASREDLCLTDKFPFDIWEKMGDENYLGLNIPAIYGGCGKSSLAVTVAGEAFVSQGHNMGMVLSWIIHIIISRFLLLEFGTEKQKKSLLPQMVKGEYIASFAVSEPETGAHPKHIKTTAIFKGDTYVLNGKKTYLTNGPIADFFVIIAQTEIEKGKKKYSAFIVLKNTPGLTVLEPMNLDILRPSLHGGIILDNCEVPASALLGEKGSAYEKMVKPFREFEDVLIMGPIIGGLKRQVELIFCIIRETKSNITDEFKELLGGIISMIDVLELVSHESVCLLDAHKKSLKFTSLELSFRLHSARVQTLLNCLIKDSGIKTNKKFNLLTKDICFAVKTGGNVAKIKQRKLVELFLRNGNFNDPVK